MEHYDGMVFEGSFGEMRQRIHTVLHDRGIRIKCLGCGKEYRTIRYSIEFEEHTGGLLFTKYNQKFWVYITCHECGYGTALWKLFPQVSPEKFGIYRLYIEVEKPRPHPKIGIIEVTDWKTYVDLEFGEVASKINEIVSLVSKKLNNIESNTSKKYNVDIRDVRKYLLGKVLTSLLEEIIE